MLLEQANEVKPQRVRPISYRFKTALNCRANKYCNIFEIEGESTFFSIYIILMNLIKENKPTRKRVKWP